MALLQPQQFAFSLGQCWFAMPRKGWYKDESVRLVQRDTAAANQKWREERRGQNQPWKAQEREREASAKLDKAYRSGFEGGEAQRRES